MIHIKSGVFLLLCSLVASAADSQESAQPYLVQDINATASPDPGDSDPFAFRALGDTYLFRARTSQLGIEWYKWTPPFAVELLDDINPGVAGSYGYRAGTALMGDRLYFSAVRKGQNGLWRTDGSTEGTTAVFEMAESAEISILGATSDRIFFLATDPISGRELWSSDGSDSGTKRLTDIGPGPSSLSYTGSAATTSLFFFGANDRLWRTDGTEPGTVAIAYVTAEAFAVSGDRLFFKGRESIAGKELWVSDGTSEGTRRVRDIYPGIAGSFASTTAPVVVSREGTAFFYANDGIHGVEPWRSDGTEQGTFMLVDSMVGTVVDDRPPELMTPGETGMFLAPHSGQIFHSDGTSAGTVIKANLPLRHDVGSLHTVGGKLLAQIYSDAPVSLFLVANGAIEKIEGPRIANNPWLAGDLLFFSGSDRLHGEEPWVTDGSSSGTHLLANLEPDVAPDSNPVGFVETDDAMYFFASDGIAYDELWKSDGTSAGTTPVVSASTGRDSLRLYGTTDQHAFFSAGAGFSATDGITVETIPQISGVSSMAARTHSEAIISHEDTVSRSDGTTAGTEELVTEYSNWRGYQKLVTLRQRVYATSGGLISFDGTAQGPLRLTETNLTTNGNDELVGSIGRLYFTHSTATNGRELWVSNGTIDGTRLVRDLVPGEISSQPRSLTPCGRGVVFLASTETATELWASDGTPSGTLRMELGAGSMDISQLSTAAGQVFFTRTDAAGEELWVTDCTGSVRQVADIAPGSAGSSPRSFLFDGGHLYFSADDGTSGRELWRTDGTEAGTGMLYDLEPGPGSSAAVPAGRPWDVLLAAATTTDTGRELWGFPLAPAAQVELDDPEVDESAGTARITLRLRHPIATSLNVSFRTEEDEAVGGEDFVPIDGTIEIPAGETTAFVDVSLIADEVAEADEAFYVVFSSEQPVRWKKRESAVLVVEGAPDLSLRYVPGQSYYNFEVTNLGTRTAGSVAVYSTEFPSGRRDFQCVLECIQIGPGESARYSGSLSSASTHVVAVSPAGDRAPENNFASVLHGGSPYTSLFLSQRYLRSGETTAVSVIARANETIALSSSDPAVLGVPSAVVIGPNSQATFEVQGLGRGQSTVGATAAFPPATTLELNVIGPDDAPRYPSTLYTETSFRPTYAQPVNFRFIVAGTTHGEEIPTGTVTVLVDGTAAATLPVVPGRSSDIPLMLSAGAREVTIGYSGDDFFFPSTRRLQVTVARAVVGLQASVPQSGPLRVGDEVTLEVVLTGLPHGDPVPPHISVGDVGGSYFASLTLVPTETAAEYRGQVKFRLDRAKKDIFVSLPAAPNYWGTVAYASILAGDPADSNLDGIINAHDVFGAVRSLLSGAPLPDINEDGVSDARDLFRLIEIVYNGATVPQ